jgi:subtilisin family serine protease
LLGFKQDNSLPFSKKTFTLPKGVTDKDYLPNTLIIKFKRNVKHDVLTESAKQQLTCAGISLITLTPLFSSKINAGQTLGNQNDDIAFSNYYRATYSGNVPIEKAINALLSSNNVAYAEPSYIHTTFYTPNDANYSNQFYLAQVRAPQAWDILKDASGVVIAIVDTGSETTHPDLAANIYRNEADPINGLDDDGDGYIDNYEGWDFCGQSASTMIPDNDPNVKSSGADHGVHVSGIASAVTDNGTGVASIAYNAKLLIVKAGPDDQGRSIYKGYEAIKYAADKGAHIINCSWGGTGGGQFGQEMIDYAVSKGCLVIAAAGNSGDDIPNYPAAFNGVLAVANLNQNDTKSSGSNFGAYVDISAPGSGIYNTVYGNGYGYKTGTSMAAPLVASAAALLKAKYPSYTGPQIGELLRATADNIDAVNSSYINLLGKGRLNINRALTEAAASVRYQNMSVNDQSLGNRAPGTEITLQFALKNFLIPVNGLNVNITSNSAFVQVLDANINAGNFSTMQTKTGIQAVRVKVLPNAPTNHQVTFVFNYTGNNGSYSDAESFTTVVALDYLNVAVNRVSTTFTSNGRVGYSGPNATSGLGFVYKDENMLYEAALMIGRSETQVMNNARVGSNFSEDFKRQQTAVMVPSNLAAFEGLSVFTDEGSTNPIGLKVTSKMWAFNTEADKYVIVEYELYNRSNTALSNIYTGLFTDWDLDNPENNATEYDAASQTAFVYAKQNVSYPFAGLKLLNLQSSAAYYPLSHQISGDFLADDFTTSEKYATLASGIKALGLGHDTATGYDVMFTLGSGPYTIPVNGAIKVAYAFLAGDNKDELLATGEAALQKYAQLNAEPNSIVPSGYALQQNYPNEAKTYTYIPFDLPEKTHAQLTIYNATGKKIKEVLNENLAGGSYRFLVDVSNLPNGVYTYQLRTASFKQAKKMIVAK